MSVDILAVLQARVSSSRLPGKVLLPLLGEPMIFRQVERVRRATTIDGLVLATSDDASDDALARACEQRGVRVFRGSLNDVLGRFYAAAKPSAPRYVVRLTGDCPLIDPEIVDRVVKAHVEGKFDYTSNSLEPTFPDGLDCEVVTFDALETAWREARLPSEREHVMPFIHRRPDRFRIGSVKNDTDLSALRWTVDEPEDYEVVKAVFEELYPKNPAFGTSDVLQLMERCPGIFVKNKTHGRNEGYAKSLRVDQEKNR